MSKKRLILVGKSAAGKDHARKIAEQWFGMPYAISYTTRPPRWEETPGRDYNFISEEEFKGMIDNNEWYEYVIFNDWYYGTTREQMNTPNQVFIMTPKGLSHLSKEDRDESLVIYLDIDEEIRRIRMGERGGNADSVERRIEADRIDFEGFRNYDVKLTDPYFKIGQFAEPIRRWLDISHFDTIITKN